MSLRLSAWKTKIAEWLSFVFVQLTQQWQVEMLSE